MAGNHDGRERGRSIVRQDAERDYWPYFYSDRAARGSGIIALAICLLVPPLSFAVVHYADYLPAQPLAAAISFLFLSGVPNAIRTIRRGGDSFRVELLADRIDVATHGTARSISLDGESSVVFISESEASSEYQIRIWYRNSISFRQLERFNFESRCDSEDFCHRISVAKYIIAVGETLTRLTNNSPHIQ